MSEVTIVLSDLHANGKALRAALTDAEARGFDRAVVLGDLLTYGVDVNEVIDAVSDLQDRRGAAVVLGNHDQLYLDLAEGRSDYYRSLPEWLRETIDWTASRLDHAAFRERFHWVESVDASPWLFAHANPWSYGDWRYLYTENDARDAALALRDRGFGGGVFGHTHRRHALAFEGVATAAASLGDDWELLDDDPRTLVVNPGSIGQPRHTDGRSTYLRLEREGRRVRGQLVSVTYDVTAHVRALRKASLSASTLAKLCRFFEPSP